MRYFIYCRKSSEAEDRQVMSIESQLSALQRAFGGRPEIEIVGIYEEAFSAKAPGRPRLSEMLSRIERGDAEGIVAWAPDRLARNSIDGGRIVYLLDLGVIHDLKFATYTFENNSQGKFMLQIMFGQSKYYSDALSENVKRGNRTKVEKGWRPNQPPLGYLNDPLTRTIVMDQERFAAVRRMFDLMLTGAYSVRRICEVVRDDWGFRTRQRRRSGGKPVALSGVYKILKNPFYAGILVWAGKIYQGAHDPIVTIDEFERVQGLFHRTEKPRPKTHHFAFTGMMRCGECGLLITAENKTNRYGSRYTYYHCTKRKAQYRCNQASVTANDLELQIEQFLTSLTISDRVHEWVMKHLSKMQADWEKMEETREQGLQSALTDVARELANLTSLRLRDLINDDEFVRERKKLDQEQLRLGQALEANAPAEITFEPSKVLISFSNRAIDWFRQGDIETRRLILESVGSNLTLKDRKLSIEAKKPFRTVSKTPIIPQLRAVVEDIRTLYAKRDNELLGILENIRKLEIKFGIRSSEDDRQSRAA
jgi:site-specific DNA recombinase